LNPATELMVTKKNIIRLVTNLREKDSADQWNYYFFFFFTLRVLCDADTMISPS
jgi:hypothetical protein